MQVSADKSLNVAKYNFRLIENINKLSKVIKSKGVKSLTIRLNNIDHTEQHLAELLTKAILNSVNTLTVVGLMRNTNLVIFEKLLTSVINLTISIANLAALSVLSSVNSNLESITITNRISTIENTHDADFKIFKTLNYFSIRLHEKVFDVNQSLNKTEYIQEMLKALHNERKSIAYQVIISTAWVNNVTSILTKSSLYTDGDQTIVSNV